MRGVWCVCGGGAPPHCRPVAVVTGRHQPNNKLLLCSNQRNSDILLSILRAGERRLELHSNILNHFHQWCGIRSGNPGSLLPQGCFQEALWRSTFSGRRVEIITQLSLKKKSVKEIDLSAMLCWCGMCRVMPALRKQGDGGDMGWVHKGRKGALDVGAAVILNECLIWRKWLLTCSLV